MADVTVKRIDEMDSLFEGQFTRARAELGVSAFGMQVINLPANWENYPEHAHSESFANDGQEEVYVALEGRATLVAGGERFELEPGVLARVGPRQLRKIVTAGEPFRMLAIGGTPGRPYEAPPFTEVGAPPPPLPG